MPFQPKDSSQDGHKRDQQSNSDRSKGIQPRQMSRRMGRSMNRFGPKVESKASDSSSLDGTVQAKMENAFQEDFSDVKVTKDSDEATQMGAQAFTQGDKIHFAPGNYKPHSTEGQELIGHELTHVVQQKQGRVKATTQAKGVAINDDSALEKEADVMGKKAASGAKAVVQRKSSQAVVQKKDKDDKILDELSARSKDQKKDYENSPKEIKSIAKDLADENFSNAFDEANFAENILQNLRSDIRDIYDNINNGQQSAISEMQSSINDKLAKQEFARSCLFGAIGILNAWAPLVASRSVSAIQQNIKAKILKDAPNINITNIKIPVFAQNIKAFGESTLRPALVSTISSINSMIKRKPETVKNEIEAINTKLYGLTQYSIHHLILKISQDFKNANKVKLDGVALGRLKAGIETEVLTTIFPEYAQYLGETTIRGIADHSKREFLTQIILNGGKIDKGSYFSDPSINGNKNKEGADLVEHALNALGGEQKLADQLKNPHEFAFASLNSTLSQMGLEINTTDEIKTEAKETNFLDQNRGFHLNLKNEKAYKDFLADKEIITNNYYSPTDGPIKQMKDEHPSEYSALFNSATTYMFKYDDVAIENVRVWIHPSEYSSMLGGKIKDINSFTLKFLTNGKANVIKREASRTGRSFSSDGTYQLNGINHIKVKF